MRILPLLIEQIENIWAPIAGGDRPMKRPKFAHKAPDPDAAEPFDSAEEADT